MDKQIPLISTRTTGPLGIAHLPRLWLKLLLAARGQLADGYRAGEGGFDGLLLDALGIASDAAIDYVKINSPTYLQFEEWIQAQSKAESLTDEAIAALNTRILTFPKPEPGRSEMLESLGLPNDDKEWLGTDINDLDDWLCVHQQIVESES